MRACSSKRFTFRQQIETESMELVSTNLSLNLPNEPEAAELAYPSDFGLIMAIEVNSM